LLLAKQKRSTGKQASSCWYQRSCFYCVQANSLSDNSLGWSSCLTSLSQLRVIIIHAYAPHYKISKHYIRFHASQYKLFQ
jgi:hypothetical protein